MRMRNEVYHDGELVSYTEILEQDGQIVFDDNGTTRPATDDEIEQYQAHVANENVWEETKQIPVSALSQLSDALNAPSVNSIAEVKNALKDFVNKIV